MKSFTLKLLSLMLVCFMLLPMLFACGEAETPPSSNPPADDKLSQFEAMSEKDKAIYILTTDYDDNGKISGDMKLSLSCNYMGYAISAIVSGKTVQIDADGTYVDYTESTMSMTMAGQSQVSVSKSGYIDGKEFSYVEVDGVGQGEYSATTKEDYIANKDDEDQDTVDDFGLTKDNCHTITCSKNSQGSWVATYTDVTEEGLAEFKELLASFEGLISADDLVDVVVTLTVSSSLQPMGVKVAFEFSGENPPVLTLDATYAIGNDVEVPDIDFSTFTDKSAPSL